jgi:N-methylhydantoinase A/oxoprolinase/acetone carboxylase beta subunit
MNTAEKQSIAVIACGVLAADLKHLANKLEMNLTFHFLPGGLHSTPDRLRTELQKTIDSISSCDQTPTRIVIGYGVCGRGTVGLHARQIPLVIPRVHDCIALFLGSDGKYREQFSAHPGTYYLSAGWIEENGGQGPKTNMGSDGAAHPLYSTYDQLAEAYGTDNADYIRDFMQSWTRNYTRSAYIDTGVGKQKEHYARKAEDMASRFDWDYARLSGTHDLLIEALNTTNTTDNILVVPPETTVRYDAIRRRLDTTHPEDASSTAHGDDQQTTASDVAIASRHGLGLGIDAGGTYTDAVLYDFDKDAVVDSAKALTTHWDYSVGIRQTLTRLDGDPLSRVRLTAISTTVATNAIVEHQGQTVGLLVMPPCGWKDPEGFRHAPLSVISGRLEIDGTEIEPVNADEIREIAQDLIQRNGVTAFAVGGYAAHANPAHELQVKSIIRESTGMSVTCSHELSDALHYRIRAETAALNARIIPCLEALLSRITDALSSAGVAAPVMVVRSDGSFMSLDAAREKPLETMLSGPAASAAGAGWLARCTDALIADIGGTTTDTAMLVNGRVRLNAEGACIGGWQTHIRALDLQTTGLGGDSHVHIRDHQILLGPERVAPICWLAATHPETSTALDWIESHLHSSHLSSSDMVLLTATGKSPACELTETESTILERLRERPYSLHELTAVLDKPHPAMVPLRRLLQNLLIQRSGFTPTDALHVAGRIALWDHPAALRMATIHASRFHEAPAQWVLRILTRFERTLAAEILHKQLTNETIPDDDTSPLATAMIARILDHDESGGLQLSASLLHPVIGIGAPAACFVPDACLRLNANAIIPPHAEVANAVGAIIGSVSISHQVRITTDENGLMHVSGVPDAPVYKTIEAATQAAEDFLRTTLYAHAVKSGCKSPAITIESDDNSAPSTDGTRIFVGRTLIGHATGAPDCNFIC